MNNSLQPTDSLKETPFRDIDTLNGKIAAMVMARGFRATTMDSIAAALSISKRTLYEIYGSKDEMIQTVFAYLFKATKREMEDIYNDSEDMMEVFARVFQSHTKFIENVSPDFFRDMDIFYKRLRPYYEGKEREKCLIAKKAFMRGVEQGVFRKDFDFDISYQMFNIQMESLKRMEEIFPADFTPAQIYNHITTGFLRFAATPKGMAVLDKILYSEEKQN